MPTSVNFLTATSLILLSSVLRAEEPTSDDGLTFREPFSGLSASEIESKLIVFLITDEDPFAWTKAKLEDAEKSRLGGGPDVWCGSAVRRSFQKLFADRPDLKQRCIVQRVVAGLPKNLTGGSANPLPNRSIVAICDGKYRLLNLSVGVPESRDLAGLIEDAEEAKTILTLHEQDPAKLGELILQRTNSRVHRVYREALAGLVEAMDWDESLYTIDDAWTAKYVNFVSELNPIYLFDAKIRFGLGDAGDLVRLIVLEQHCETRRDWCECVAPFIVGRPMQQIMGPVIDTAWGMPAVLDVDKSQHEELLRWYSAQRENVMFVLSVKPTYLDRNIPWPPPSIGRSKAAQRDWNSLEKAMSNHPFRSVTAEELAVVLRENDEMPINLLAPSRPRYVVFEPGKKRLVVIREPDVPGKFIQRFAK